MFGSRAAPDQLVAPANSGAVLRVPEHALTMPAEMNTALSAAIQAANAVRACLESRSTVGATDVKQLVARAELEADQAISKVLDEMSPGTKVISKFSSPDHLKSADKAWIVEPLEGATALEFRAGADLPAVMVAKMKDYKLVLGAVVFPLTGECFYAHKGQGAFKDGVKLEAADGEPALSDAWVDLQHYRDVDYETSGFGLLRERLDSKRCAKVVTSLFPNSVGALRVIEGAMRLSAVVYDNNSLRPNQAVWNMAAPMIIVKEAGGVFLSLEGCELTPFDCKPLVVARSRALAMEIVELAHQTHDDKQLADAYFSR